VAKPLWRRVFDGVERPLGARLEQAVQTDAFARGTGLVLRTRAGVARTVERTSRRALHQFNLPAATDVVQLRDQVASLERTVRRLETSVSAQARAQESGGPDGSGSGADRPGSARPARRRTQPAPRAQRDQVRDRDRPT
jgi:hypothetical protein